MAKYVPSALIGRISRSAGATTFAHNRFGSYFRNRVIPTNPSTSAQTLVRASLGGQSALYRTISDAARAAWTALGANIIRTDTLGETYTLTGLQAFVSVNRNLYTTGAAQVLAAPAYSPPADLMSVTVTAVGA